MYGIKNMRMIVFQEDFYDPIHQTGYMEMFIRTKRSRSLGIETRWTNRSVRTLLVHAYSQCIYFEMYVFWFISDNSCPCTVPIKICFLIFKVSLMNL